MFLLELEEEGLAHEQLVNYTAQGPGVPPLISLRPALHLWTHVNIRAHVRHRPTPPADVDGVFGSLREFRQLATVLLKTILSEADCLIEVYDPKLSLTGEGNVGGLRYEQ